MFRRNDHGNGKIGGGGKPQPSLSRWGSFTKALPTLIRGNSTTTNGVGHGKHHQQNGREQQLKRHNNQMAPIGRKYTNSTAAGGVDPNNNNHGKKEGISSVIFVFNFKAISRLLAIPILFLLLPRIGQNLHGVMRSEWTRMMKRRMKRRRKKLRDGMNFR
jgi:hypothetical protein